VKNRRWEFVGLGVALSILVLIALARGQAERANLSFYSTYDSGPNGYRALYSVLGRSGIPVRRFERELGLLDPDVHTLVISSQLPELVQSRGRRATPTFRQAGPNTRASR
jgi:hypothetical protein